MCRRWSPCLNRRPQPEPRQQSYGQILKSSALVGGSSVLNIGIGIVRTKAMAMLLGPAGFGLFGLYGSIADLTLTVAGMGINSSGVRQIAEAVGSGKWTESALTTVAFRRERRSSWACSDASCYCVFHARCRD